MTTHCMAHTAQCVVHQEIGIERNMWYDVFALVFRSQTYMFLEEEARHRGLSAAKWKVHSMVRLTCDPLEHCHLLLQHFVH